jgi:hypothetical protein
VIDTDADPRDLSFHAVRASEDNKVLTDEQITFFNGNGFLTPLPALGADGISEIRQYIDDLITKVVEPPDQCSAYSTISLSAGNV